MMYIEDTFGELWSRLANDDVVSTAQTFPVSSLVLYLFFLFLYVVITLKTATRIAELCR
jgi:hypothetical protein